MWNISLSDNKSCNPEMMNTQKKNERKKKRQKKRWGRRKKPKLKKIKLLKYQKRLDKLSCQSPFYFENGTYKTGNKQ